MPCPSHEDEPDDLVEDEDEDEDEGEDAPPEVEDPAIARARNVRAVEKLVGLLHSKLRVPRGCDGEPDVDVISAYNLMVIDVCHAVSRVASTIGF